MIADSPLIGKIILILVLIAIDAFCSCAEIAVISLDASELEKMAEEKQKAERLLKFLRQPAKFLTMIQAGDHTVRISDQCLYGRSACTVDDRSCDGAVYTPGFGKSLA